MTELHRISDSLAGRPPTQIRRTFRRMELAEAPEREPFIDSLGRANFGVLDFSSTCISKISTERIELLLVTESSD